MKRIPVTNLVIIDLDDGSVKIENQTKKTSSMNPSGHYIQGRELTEANIGDKVTYVPTHANGDCSHKDAEGGHIKSWNDGGAFIQYSGYVARTSFSDLVWG